MVKQWDLWVVLCHWHSCPRYRRNTDGTACSMSHKSFLLGPPIFLFIFSKLQSYPSPLTSEQEQQLSNWDTRPWNRVKCTKTLSESPLLLNSRKINCNCIMSQPVTVNSCRLSLVGMNKYLYYPHMREVPGKQQKLLASLLRLHAVKLKEPHCTNLVSYVSPPTWFLLPEICSTSVFYSWWHLEPHDVMLPMPGTEDLDRICHHCSLQTTGRRQTA